MRIFVKKSGKWAHNGIEIIDLVEGVQDVSESLAMELIESGRAYVEPEFKKEEAAPIYEEKKDFKVLSVEKGKIGWWTVLFKGIDEKIKVRASSKQKAIDAAILKLEAE